MDTSEQTGGINGSGWRKTERDQTQSVETMVNEQAEDRVNNPETSGGADNDYTELDEQSYTTQDEENDSRVGSRAGLANMTQDVEASPPDEFHDDAEIREGKLPVQDVGYGGEHSEADADTAD
jgi:hypothetical protein